MYPQLYHFFYDQFGWDIPFLRAINSFGFFVALAFLSGAWAFSSELKRKFHQGLLKSSLRTVWIGKPASFSELAINAVIGLLLGYKLVFAFMHKEVFNNFPDFLLSAKGNWVGAVFTALLLTLWKYYEVRKHQLPQPLQKEIEFLPQQHVGPLLTLAAIFGFLGAKIFAYLEDPGDFIEFISDPFSGLTMYGGLICALAAGYFYMRKHNLPPLVIFDSVAPSIMLAYGVGRIGCHISGDGDWGVVNIQPNPGWLPDWLWAYDYPNNVNNAGVPLGSCYYNDQYCKHLEKPVFPTALYEAILSIGLFGLLWVVRKRYTLTGIMFFSYLMLNGVERFLIEKIRVNKTYEIFGRDITQAEIISFTLILTGLGGILYLLRKNKSKPTVGASGDPPVV